MTYYEDLEIRTRGAYHGPYRFYLFNTITARVEHDLLISRREAEALRQTYESRSGSSRATHDPEQEA